ncbi:MAG: hypothetical protein ACREOF_10610 [Gemmatimonadales bacterium]
MGALLLAGSLIACGPEPTEPYLTPGLPLPPASDPDPTLPDQPSASPLIGSWRGVVTAFLPSHVQTVTWRFSPDGSCSQTFLTIADGIELTETRACTWTTDARAATVTVTRMGATTPVTFTLRYSFPSADVLRLDGDEFSRVG